MLKHPNQPVFQVPTSTFETIRSQKQTAGISNQIIKPLGLKRFLFTQGKCILVTSAEEFSCTPILLSVQWNAEGTDFTLAPTSVDIRI